MTEAGRWCAPVLLVCLLVGCEAAAPPCDSDEDCAAGTYCRALVGCTSECEANADCPGGGTCSVRGRCTGGATDGGACSDEACDDGVFCNGAERCAAGVCAPGNARCLAGQSCDEARRTCVTDCSVSGDADGDGHDSVTCGGDDCDDADPNRFPGNAEVCNTHDEDCDSSTFGTRDADGDGAVDAACCDEGGCGTDCDDRDPDVKPSQAEVCNGIDDNCDDAIDEGLLVAVYEDADGDLFGSRAAAPMMRCPGAPGYSTVGTDCNDRDPSFFPGATELCDLADQDCDGEVDEGAGVTYYRDFDRDGYGVDESMVGCPPTPSGWATDRGDCNDMASASNPGGVEVCDGLDNDCNGTVDDALGNECTNGLGACLRYGRRYCSGECSTPAGAPTTTARTVPAPNGSWDWDCDGTVTTEITTFEARDAVSGALIGPATFATPPTISFLPYQSSDPDACTASGCGGSDLVCWPASMSTTSTTCGAALRCLLRGSNSSGNSCLGPRVTGAQQFRSCYSTSGACGQGQCYVSGYGQVAAIYARVSCR